jgi:group I intron endonuclease
MVKKTNHGIYQIRNLVNDKIYNGQTNDLTKRENKWSNQLENKEGRYNQHLERSYHKYGADNFTFNISIENLLPEQLDEYEIAMIKFTKSHDPEYGYNKTMGGEGGIPNEETRKKKSEIATKSWENDPERRLEMSERVSGENNPSYGGLSEEHKEKLKGPRPSMQGEDNPKAKLTDQDVFEIKSYLLIFGHLRGFIPRIARVYGVHSQTIRRIKRNESWTHVKVPGWVD